MVKASEATPHSHVGGVKEAVFPLFVANDGYTKHDGDGETTATCFCGGVQYAFPIRGEGVGLRFMCHCTDCRKVSASLFATNFTVKRDHLRLVRGQDLLRSWGQSNTVGSPRNGHTMTNTWCNNCGALMHRISSGTPDDVYMRLGQVDDFALHETDLKPEVELFVKDRASFLHPAEGVKQFNDMSTPADDKSSS